MSSPESHDEPLTAGDLRRRLAEMGNPWTVDPRLGDEDPVPEYPRGGQLEEDAPESDALLTRPLATDVDFHEILREVPPTNLDLRALWIERGLLEDDSEAPGSGS